MNFYVKQKEIEWRSIISKVLPMKVFISEFDFLTCNLKLYDCSREAQHYVKDKNASYQFMDILSKINLDMRTSVLFKQNTDQKKSKSTKSKKVNFNKQKEEKEQEKIHNYEKEKTFQQIQNDHDNNLIDLKTYLLHRHISIEKDQQKESAKQIKFNILNPFQSKKKNQNNNDQEEINAQNTQNKSNQDKIYQNKQIDVQNLYKMDSLTGYYFEEDEKTVIEKLKIKIAFYQLYKPLLVVYFEDQTIQNEYINIKEEKQRFDVLFIEILESFRIQITQILKQGFDSNMLKSTKNRLLLLLNNLYIIFDYYMLSQVKKNGILNLQIQSQELNIKRNSFSIQDAFKEIKDIYKEAVAIKIPESIKNKIIFNDIRRLKQILFATISSMTRMCSKSQISIEVNSDQEKRELWKGIKFTINGIKDIQIKESSILDYFSYDNCNQLNDLTLYVLNNVTKIIGPFNFKSFCSPSDEIVFEFTIFEDIKQVYSQQQQQQQQSMFLLQSQKNSPTLAPCLSSKLNQTLINSQEDVTKTSIASPCDLRQRAVSNNIMFNQINQQDLPKQNEKKQSQNIFNTACKLRKVNTVHSFSNNNQNNKSENENESQPIQNNQQNIETSYQNNSHQINHSDLSEYQNSFQSQLSKSIKNLPNKLKKMKSFNLNEEILKKKKNSINIELDLQSSNKLKSPNDSGEVQQPNTRMSIFSKNQILNRGVSYSYNNNNNKSAIKQLENKQFSDSSIQNQFYEQSQIDHQPIIDYLNDESKHEYFLSSNKIMANFQKELNDQSYQHQPKIQQKVILDINSQESDSEKSQKMDQINLEDSEKNTHKNGQCQFSSQTLNEEVNQLDFQHIKNFIYSQNFKTFTDNQLLNKLHFNYNNKSTLPNKNFLEQS
ncbi:hypothetical protein TTHERM_01332100 (macronuclear) [Tetrahymena thermophila SB210]|uniref:Uncharacterized protein n=1 Tax=Tetrahymena thermophila (strain SB210) TaxID=312017 RepID=Q22WV3_TETTS|nr:hypothetical protein TTHERM_01332100 [Tetrahymena thermophila SB210]EAR89760.2 hypothetical protein TTHERM_01332100 [Tetrahymena thermophila SB210]|eukprot:XP_001010005.2 hypothetical protein TTHERM_01332100 [Tetrahymena thermophila SB210]